MADMEELQALVASLQASLQDANALLPSINDEAVAVQAEKFAIEQAYQEQMKVIKARQADIEMKKWEAQKAANAVKYELQAAQSKIAEAEALKKAAEEAEQKAAEEAKKNAELEVLNKALTERMDHLTMTAPWREWAKDHQISAGHMITRNRNVILADPMGLGKTLSSIITVEMAERVTKEASPEFPFLGEEDEVYVPEQWTLKPEYQNSPECAKLAPASRWRPAIENLQYYDHSTAHYETKIVNGITRPVGRRVLYLCPNSLLRNVMSEFRMWAPHRNVTYIGGMSKAEREFLFEYGLQGIADYAIICNFEAWRRDNSLIKKLIELEFDTVIIDEAHNAKDRKTRVWKGINAILEGYFDDKTNGATGRKPDYIIPMTGTPILNRPQELFTLLNMVNPKKFNNENFFLQDYCEQYETDEGQLFWKFREGGLERLAKLIPNNFLRRTRQQAGIELPEKTIIYHDLDVDTETYPAQAKARDQMRKFMTVIVDEKAGKALSAQAVIAMFTRLRQIETWPAGIVQRDKVTKEIIMQLDVTESQKIDYIIRKDEDGQWNGLIPEAIEDERIVLFSQFKAPLHEIKNRIERAGYRAAIMDGDTPKDLMDEIHRDFDRRYTADRDKSKWDVVLCNYKVGGVGLNLTAATQLIALDEEWNPGKRDQAFDRIHRIGQEEAVTIHVVRDKNTIDDWLASIMENKEALVQGFEVATSNLLGKFKDALDSGLI